MATEMKRFTISVTQEMETGLEAVKKDKFYNTSQSEMIRHLLDLGLSVYTQNTQPQTRVAANV